MAQLETIDQRKRREDLRPQSRFAPTTTGTWGVQNAVLDRGVKASEQPTTANDNRAPRSRFANNSRVFTTPEQPANTNAAPRVVPSLAAQERGKNEKNTVKASEALKLKALFITTILTGCTGLTQYVQILTSTIALILAGVTWAVTGNWVYDAALKVYNYVGELFGFAQPIDLVKLTMIFVGVTIFINWVSLGVCLLALKLSGINGLGGQKGGGVKTLAFVGAMILGNIPVVNLIPFTWIWLWAVRANPK